MKLNLIFQHQKHYEKMKIVSLLDTPLYWIRLQWKSWIQATVHHQHPNAPVWN